MQLKKLLKKWDLTSLTVKARFLEEEWQPTDEDKNAAWDLYIELITRVSTQPLDPHEGDDAAALKSMYDLFPLTRSTIKRNGRRCINFTRIAVVALNQKVRPFTAKWHPRLLADSLREAEKKQFRAELERLQADLRNYTSLLAELADVEDLTDLEDL